MLAVWNSVLDFHQSSEAAALSSGDCVEVCGAAVAYFEDMIHV